MMKQLSRIALFLLPALLPALASANLLQQGLDDAATGSGLPTATQELQPTIGRFIGAAVLLVGSLGMAALVAAGIMLIASWGSENVKERAKKAIIYALAGITLIFFAYVIVIFFVEELPGP